MIGNCIIDISPDQGALFLEAFRVLRPGGRVAFSSVVATSPIMRASLEPGVAHSADVACAASPEDVRRCLENAGFQEVRVIVDDATIVLADDHDPSAERHVASATVEGEKPRG